MLALHPVKPCGNARQGFPAALLPLQETVAFLQDHINVPFLHRVQPDFLLVFRIPQDKVLQPFGDRFLLFHFRKGLGLVFVSCPLFAKQPLITGKFLRMIVQHSLPDGNRPLLGCHKLAFCFGAVSLVNQLMLLLYQRYLVLLRFPLLLL